MEVVWKRKDKTFGKRLSILKDGPIPSIKWTQQQNRLIPCLNRGGKDTFVGEQEEIGLN
ncbi:MAG: hypothetical protein QXG99_02075 [Conexivisphaerales archaeon]